MKMILPCAARMLVSLAAAIGILGCSTQEFLSGGSLLPAPANGKLSDGETNPPGSEQVSVESQVEIENDREAPPVDVAGSNLVGDCYYLRTWSTSADVVNPGASAECFFHDPKGSAQVVAESPRLVSSIPALPIITGVISGVPAAGVAQNTYLVTASTPLMVQFDVPVELFDSIFAGSGAIEFDTFGMAGKQLMENKSVAFTPHRKQPTSQCAKDQLPALPEIAGGVIVPSSRALPGIFFQIFRSALGAIDFSSCDVALELATADFQTSDGMVLIQDVVTQTKTVVFSKVPFGVIAPDGLSYYQRQPVAGVCPSKASQQGKWICSDYLNIFSADIASGKKVFQVISFGSQSIGANLMLKAP